MNIQLVRNILLTIVATLLLSALPLCADEKDDRIVSSAKESYIFKTYLEGDAIDIQSKDGEVTLSGTVKQLFHKDLAQETVENLPGVKKVDNQLKLQGEEPSKNSDRWIEMKIETMLWFYRNVSKKDTIVTVNNGIVTLQGVANSEAQKELTAEYAKDIEGVKEVKNEMKVVVPTQPEQTMSEKIDDTSITVQVKWALLFHWSTSVLKTTVHTTDGIVTVSGEAKNAAEIALVTKLVNNINGVKEVVNNMTIK